MLKEHLNSRMRRITIQKYFISQKDVFMGYASRRDIHVKNLKVEYIHLLFSQHFFPFMHTNTQTSITRNRQSPTMIRYHNSFLVASILNSTFYQSCFKPSIEIPAQRLSRLISTISNNFPPCQNVKTPLCLSISLASSCVPYFQVVSAQVVENKSLVGLMKR